MDAPDRADLQPNASHDARLAGEDSEPEGTTQRSTSLARLRGALSLLGAEINAEAERSREPRRGKAAEAKLHGPAKA
jgi:hypothetical protein